jgi:inner membrane transporter RhtA
MANFVSVRSVAVPPWALAVGSMLSVQLGLAFSVELVASIGSAATAWLRLTFGALVFLVLARPPIRRLRRQDVVTVIGLGLVTATMTLAVLFATERIPLGTVVAIEFLGPLTVAALRSADRRARRWPALAFVGVVLLTEPWRGEISLAGVALAAVAAAGWGAYIVLTQRIGDRMKGIDALALTIPIAALAAAPFGVPQAFGHFTLSMLAAAAGLALLLPVLPFALEVIALRRMTTAAFGTLMALEPVFGTLLGLVVLRQTPTAMQVVGIALVVAAGVAAQQVRSPA